MSEVFLQNLVSSGLGKLSLVTIELDPEKYPWENPQEIFESMNSLGKPLSLADLCRNYLLISKKAEEQDELYKNYWLEMEDTISGEISNFIRDYMQLQAKSSYPKAKEGNTKELYASFKRLFSNCKADDLLESLKYHSSLYTMVINGTGTGNDKIDRLLSDLQALKSTNLNPFLMGILDRWTKSELTSNDVIEILNIFCNYILRRRILKLTSAENKEFPLYTLFIDDLIKASNKSEFILNKLISPSYALRFPNDNEIRDTLQNTDFYSFNHKKFLLSLIEEGITKSNPYNDKNVEVEHIMPKVLNSEWKSELGRNYDEIHDKFLNRLGNLTLVRHNQEIGNKSFAYKKNIYQGNEGLAISRKMITDKNVWGPKEIIAREEWVITQIVDVVAPLPSSMKKRSNYSATGKAKFSFVSLNLVGKKIHFIDDPNETATVVSDKEVEYQGTIWKLSPLTRYLKEKNGNGNSSGSYRGKKFWTYKGVKLSDM